MKKEDFQKSHESTGSAEDLGESRSMQKNKVENVDPAQKKNISHEAGLGRDRMRDIEDLGDMSGRDDYSGGDDNGMSNQSTNESTEKF